MAKKSYTAYWILGGVALVLLLMLFWVIGTYNSLVTLDEEANAKWANVESSYQRRIDLIPNLVATVKGSAEFETNLQTKVTELRTGISTATNPGDFDVLGTKISSAINLVFENYPEVKSTENFRDLQVQLEGTENRINVERNRYNEAVKNYNRKTRFFPSNIIANMFGFEKKDLFESAEGSEIAPEVNF